MRVVKEGEGVRQISQISVRLDVVQLEFNLAEALVECIKLEEQRISVVGSGTSALDACVCWRIVFGNIFIEKHRHVIWPVK